MISAPDYIQLYPTVRCNLSCEFCFSRNVPEMEDMSPGAFRALADSLAQLGVRTIDILGGEPTLHEDLPQLLQYGLKKGLALNLSSNATDTAQLAEIMQRAPAVRVGISVNDQETADRLDAFIRDQRPVVKTIVGSSPDARLIGCLRSLGAKELYLLYRDALEPSLLPETMPFDAFLRTVRREFSTGPEGTVFCSGFLPDLRRYPSLRTARCPAGTTKLGVLPDGSVWPCNLFFGIEAYRLGNILTDPFPEIWQHPLLARFRTFAGNQCPRRDCALHRACHGGCPAHSLVHAGTPDGPEPRCLRPFAE